MTTKKEYTIRFANIEDFKKVREFDPHSQFIEPQKINSKIHQKEIIIAVEGGNIIGILKFSYFWATRPYIDLIWIDESYRKQGIGKQCIQFLEDYLIKQGYCYLFISAEESEIESQSYHQHMGFTKCGKVSSLNLPQDTSNEVFFVKRIAKGDSSKDSLQTYSIY
jgi:ribosomal protein S18 acetylase RimI-like enzyme